MRNWLSDSRLLPLVVLSSFFSSACDIVQGFKDASTSLFPPERTYFDAPGFRWVAGGYRDIHFAAGTDLYVYVRSSDPADDSLYGMRYADSKPCAIPKVGDFRGATGTYKGPAVIAYYETGAEDEVLRFADGTCHRYDLTIGDASLPFREVPQGFLVRASGDVLLVDPIAGTIQPLVSSVVDIQRWGAPDLYVLQIAGRIVLYRSDWKEIGRYGDDVRKGTNIGNNYYFRDESGIHRLTASGSEPQTVSDELIGAHGCDLKATPTVGASEEWLTFRAPCDSATLTLYSDSSGRATPLSLPAETEQVALLPSSPSLTGDPATDPFFFFYVTEIDDSGLGRLVLRGPDGADHTIGGRSSFDRFHVFASSPAVYGYALVDIDTDDETGQYVMWHVDGSTTTLAERMRRDGSDVILDPSGAVGDFALPSSEGLQVVAKRVPYHYFRFDNRTRGWRALLSDSDGVTATLSITASELDFEPAARSLLPNPVGEITPIARDVVADERAQFVQSLPGLVYLTHYDKATNTGRLDYRNLELGFTGTVSEGVSDYVGSSDSLIYAVPFGQGAGLWAVRAR